MICEIVQFSRAVCKYDMNLRYAVLEVRPRRQELTRLTTQAVVVDVGVAAIPDGRTSTNVHCAHRQRYDTTTTKQRS